MTEAQKRALMKYKTEKVERLGVDIPKGKRAVYIKKAKELGISLAQLVQVGVEEFSRTHTGEFSFEPASPSKTWEAALLVENFQKLPKPLRVHVSEIVRALANGVESAQEDAET